MAGTATAGVPPEGPGRDSAKVHAVAWIAALAAPMAGFWLLVANPSIDPIWEHDPSHFWLVLVAAAVSAVVAVGMSTAARRRGDARVFLISLAFLAAAGFLGLHALATPRVLLDGPNAGFAIATPVGLVIAGVFAAASAIDLDGERASWVMRHSGRLIGALLAAMGAWALVSLAALAPLDDPTPVESASSPLVVMALVGLALFGWAAYRYLALLRHSRPLMVVGVASAFVLLAEAAVAVGFSESWHATWWEWHLLMLLAFGLVAVAAQREWRDERFSDLYLAETASGEREVSVVFVDLEGFTAFSASHPPREVSRMLNAYFEVAIPPVIKGESGEVDRLIGDAMLATFNTRGDQPDHAERACRAALRIQVEATAIAERNPDWPGLRAAVNTGNVAVGVVGARGHRSYTVIGDAVNVAARLQALALVGAVVIGPDTRAALGEARVESLGPVALKGKEEPIEAWRLHSMSE